MRLSPDPAHIGHRSCSLLSLLGKSGMYSKYVRVAAVAIDVEYCPEWEFVLANMLSQNGLIL